MAKAKQEITVYEVERRGKLVFLAATREQALAFIKPRRGAHGIPARTYVPKPDAAPIHSEQAWGDLTESGKPVRRNPTA